MVVIRLTRIGKKKQAFYRIVAADSHRFVNSKFIEILGWYNPKTKEVSLKNDRITEWISKGAQPSITVAKLLKASGMKLPDWVKITEKVSKPKKEPVVKEVKAEEIVEEQPIEEDTTSKSEEVSTETEIKEEIAETKEAE
ncbi:MAG: 30S ribosomal protein S16 [bacterium]